MHEIAFLQDLAVVLLVAGATTLLFHRIKQPVVLGYILAGLIIGPYTPPFSLVSDEASIRTLADLGMILLMFSLGLHFSLRQLMQVGPTAFLAATLEIAVMGWLGYEVGRLFGWSQMDSVFLGAVLSVSSTTIIVKALQDLGLMREKFAELIFGILIVEDILAIGIIAVLSGIAQSGHLEARAVAQTLGQLAMFLVVTLVAGLLAVPPLMRYVAKFKSEEMLVVTAIGLCFGAALLAARFGYSVALGAFLIGAITAEAREKGMIERLVEPVRDVFSAIFFVTVGMLIDPRLLLEYALPIGVITVVVVVGKVLTCSAGPFLAGHDLKTSLRVGMGVSQIGEFSFIIAQLGLTLNVTSKFLYPIAVMVSAITTLSTPYLIRASGPLVDYFGRTAPSQLVSSLDFYTAWVERLAGSRQGSSEVRRLLRRWSLQIALNMALVTGLLVGAAAVGRRLEAWLPGPPSWMGGPKAAAWLVALLLALPLLIASVRKLRAAATLMAEVSLRRGTAEQVARARGLMVRAILFVGSAGLMAWVLLVSAAMLPPLPGLLVLAAVVVGVGAVMWRTFVRAYARAQISLTETLSQAKAEDAPPQAVMGLEGVVLETVWIPAGWEGGGRLVGGLEIHSRTGASVAGIQRAGACVFNPGRDEEIREGDKVLLIGLREQIDAARELLLRAEHRKEKP